MRHHGALHGESLDVRRLAGEKAERDEEREVGVLVPRRFEAPIEIGLDLFPNGVAVRLDHHAPAHDFGRLGEVTSADDVLVPLGKILVAGRDGIVRHRAPMYHETEMVGEGWEKIEDLGVVNLRGFPRDRKG